MKGMEGRKSQAKSLVLLCLALFFLLKAIQQNEREVEDRERFWKVRVEFL